MKNLTEMFEQSRSIRDQINESRVDEGLKDIFNKVKEKFSKLVDKVVSYFKYVCVKAGTYFIPVDDEGELMTAISPLTMGQAMKDGKINKSSTFIYLDNEASKITGYKSNLKDAFSIYGNIGQDAIAYWEFCASKFESSRHEFANVNEVKLGHNDPFAVYNTIVDNKMLKAAISRHIRKPLARLMIWGAPGIGKTAILRSVLEELGAAYKDHKLIVKTLSNETPDNFTLPDYVEINGERKATDVPKTWLPVYKPSGDPARDQMLDEACGKGLLFIDELSRATAQVQSVILPLINEGEFNGYKMGSGWSIICASNRDEDESGNGSQTKISAALSNRFAHVYYEPTVNTWREWADKQGFMSPLLLQWLSMPESEEFSGGKYYYYDPNEEYDDGDETKLMCSPRAWTNAMMDLATCEYTLEEGNLSAFRIMDIPRDYLKMVLNEYVPSNAVDSFCSFLDVVAGIGDFDAAVESVWKKGGKGLKIDARTLNKVALPLAQLVICQRGGKTLPSTEEFTSLCTWIADSNNDRLASYVIDIIKNVYFSSLSEHLRPKMFVLRKTWDVLNEEERQRLHYTYNPILTAYGLKSCEELPDYSIGLKLVAAKYKEVFKDAQINGKDGLG
jgi:hypothetical protein